MAICAVCHREARGFGYNPSIARENGKAGKACSIEHLNILKENKGMIDPTQNEIDATMDGGRSGGQYLESIGKTDLVTLTEEEWKTFLLCVTKGYTEYLATMNDDIPF